ncbi:MAG: ADP-ribosylglycohydrolase family protein [Thermodesulfobacteriota bacterium]
MLEKRESGSLADSLLGCLWGAAVGDAWGLPYEGLSRRRQLKLRPELIGYHFFLGRGLVSDDAEHALLTARALAASAGDPEKFGRGLAWKLRFWLLGLPAGVGLATLRSLLKLWLGFPYTRSGVFSAGNGPAMRSAIIGAAFGPDPVRLKELVKVSTRITHIDPKAEAGALAVALAAHQSSLGRPDPEEYLSALTDLLKPEAGELLSLMRRAAEAAVAGRSTEDFAAELGLERGVTGYMYHTVPVALHAWLSHPADFQAAVSSAIRCGGDTDTVASIVGAIVGAGVGPAGLPAPLLDNLWLWPWRAGHLEALARSLAEAVETGRPRSSPGPFFPAVWVRNLFFLALVLAHGFRRLLPPY